MKSHTCDNKKNPEKDSIFSKGIMTLAPASVIIYWSGQKNCTYVYNIEICVIYCIFNNLQAILSTR
jgi:hypothetical protein